jgi:hypothetical protein
MIEGPLDQIMPVDIYVPGCRHGPWLLSRVSRLQFTSWLQPAFSKPENKDEPGTGASCAADLPGCCMQIPMGWLMLNPGKLQARFQKNRAC